MDFDHYKFRRQFLLTPNICSQLKHWQQESVGKGNLYVHPDVQLTVNESNKGKLKMALVGYMIDPEFPAYSNLEILGNLLASDDSVDGISEYLNSMAGRFVLIVEIASDIFIWNDACGLRTVYYAEHEGIKHIGSQPLIFKYVMPVQEGDKFRAYQESNYRKKDIEHWLPSGISLYENIHQLVPNFYLKLSTLKQHRFWPKKKLLKRKLNDTVNEVSELLVKLVKAGNTRFDLAFALTGGWDSRILFAACKSFAPDLYFYTLKYRNYHADTPDIKIPRDIMNSLGYDYHLLDCRKEIDPQFAEMYASHASNAHIDDWGKIAYGMLDNYPSEKVALRGNCAEIFRCGYYEAGKHPSINSVDQLMNEEPDWKTVPFLRDHMNNWFLEASEASKAGVDLLDLFYMEHRMGGWQAQSILEWDIIHEVYMPFNHRGMVELMLGISPKYRRYPDWAAFRMIGEKLFPEVMKFPIKPPESINSWVKYIVTSLKMYPLARMIFRDL